MLNRLERSQQLLTVILLFAFPLTFAQKILVNSLKSVGSIDFGVTKTISIPDYESLLGVSVFGWIRVVSPTLFGRIFFMDTTPLQDKMDNQVINTFFSLSFSKWGSPQLIISVSSEGQEEQSLIDLFPEELNSWVFVYLGHQFLLSRQTYFKYSSFDQQKITKNVNEVKRFESFQISIGIGHYEHTQFFNDDIERLSIHMGNHAYKETNFQPLFVLHPESAEMCALGFTECAYTGKSINLCQSQLQTEVKSILLGNAQTADICVGSAQMRVDRNIECIEELSLKRLGKLIDIQIVSLDKQECIQ